MKGTQAARELASVLRGEGGLIAAALSERAARGAAPLDPTTAALVDGLPAHRAFALAAVREGYLLHYGAPRLVEGADEGLTLLAGDRLYALGLARLAAAGDLAAVRELADLISRCAHAHAEGDGTAAQLAWEAAGARLAR